MSSYDRVTVNGARFYMHRLVWELFNGSIPIGHHVHHKDGNIHNNHIDNLECMPAGVHRSQHERELIARDPVAYSAMKAAVSNMRSVHTIWCVVCGEPRVTNHPRTKFCSPDCSAQERNRRTANARSA